MNICVSSHATGKRDYLRGEQSFSIMKAYNNNKQFFVWRELLNVFAALPFIETWALQRNYGGIAQM